MLSIKFDLTNYEIKLIREFIEKKKEIESYIFGTILISIIIVQRSVTYFELFLTQILYATYRYTS